ncbi:alcohol dehydrogenase [Neoroseomonas lacus]|uniref:alcohol dehydrogenase n=2 Tax=Neoroseomonas lacus TaxID=287609 RepID=A0A917L4G3_9PROT|nr:alcohol dehydrogenase [Neoroseomonas lacus]
MIAMAVSNTVGRLDLVEREVPSPGAQEVLVRVRACGVCRTDLHVVDRDLPGVRPGLIPGHEIVGSIECLGADVTGLRIGQRVGVPWLGSTCGTCPFCRMGSENLCDAPGFTGYTRDGGYSEFAIADSRYCFPLPEGYGDAEAAPLLCAGLIGHRSLRMAGNSDRLGIYGFGAAAHIVAQLAIAEGRRVFAFTSPGDAQAQEFARRMGVEWAGGSDAPPPTTLDAAIIFAPVGGLVPTALAAVRKGGTVVCGGIHMSDIPTFPYRLLWGEKVLRSVANLTRDDAIQFLALAPRVPVRTEVIEFPLRSANEALSTLRQGKLSGAAVLIP